MANLSILVYDPPGGWRYGFPRQYNPQEGEHINDTLRRDGYPNSEIVRWDGQEIPCRFFYASLDNPTTREINNEIVRLERRLKDHPTSLMVGEWLEQKASFIKMLQDKQTEEYENSL